MCHRVTVTQSETIVPVSSVITPSVIIHCYLIQHNQPDTTLVPPTTDHIIEHSDNSDTYGLSMRDANHFGPGRR